MYGSSLIRPSAEAYKRDLPEAELHILNAGHFALDERVDEIAALMLDFFKSADQTARRRTKHRDL